VGYINEEVGCSVGGEELVVIAKGTDDLGVHNKENALIVKRYCLDFLKSGLLLKWKRQSFFVIDNLLLAALALKTLYIGILVL